ncbi:MAG: hypothetical protein M1574_05300 [Gammaproteobacteria bacterium]|nr:hypothetical protein [Gammaproteobacteria bacterium]
MSGSSVVFSAPGKVVLIGEYAVLENGAAYVRAVDVRARVRIDSHASKHLLEAPDINVAEIEFEATAGRKPIWRRSDGNLQAPRELDLAGTVLADVLARSTPPPCRIRLDTSAFFAELGRGGRTKIGLGSSAALTVALDAAIHVWTWGPEHGGKHEDQTTVLTRLQALHTGHQGGRGSGLDIAASLCGGTFVYRRGESHPKIAPLPLPDGLEFLCVWTGRSSSTGGFLERLAAWRRRNERAYERFMNDLAHLSDQGIDAASRGDADRFCATVSDYRRLLDGLGSAASLPIVSPVHRRLEHLATKNGVTYKPSGAGGGDIGIAFAADTRGAQRFRDAASNEGFLVLSCPEAPAGLRREAETT